MTATHTRLARWICTLTCSLFLLAAANTRASADDLQPSPEEVSGFSIDDAAASPQVADRPQSPQRRFGGGGLAGVYKSRIQPTWFDDNKQFWYRNDLADRAKEFIVVEAAKGERKPAFDHAKLAESLSKANDAKYDAKQVPFNGIEFTDGGKTMRFVVRDSQWECNLDSYECKKIGPAPEGSNDAEDNQGGGRFGRGQRRGGGGGNRGGRGNGGPSPDGKWNAYVRNNNIYLKPAGGNADGDKPAPEYQLTTDGTEDSRYGMLQWAPDSKSVVAFKIAPGDRKEVYLVESSPQGGGRAVMRSRPYDLPGDKLTSYELAVFNIEQKNRVKTDVEKIDLGFPRIYWNRDGQHLAYEKVDRGHQRLRIIDIDTHTGKSFDIMDEKTDTFIWTVHTENLDLEMINWLPETDEAIYVSEQDGWRHLYLLDTKNGGIKKQITKGEYVLRGIDQIDKDKRQVWFHASGKNADQDPYFLQYYRVNFDGTGLVALTEGNGNHTVQFSPDRKFLIDSYSRVDAPPKHELRSAEDGKLLCKLEEADAKEMMARDDYHPLEVFVNKGRDGKTDIWGVICRPRDFDPNKKYPVIESIYAGPQGSFVPKSFGQNRYASMADLGFIVVQIDGMGTANRSKAFHDVCWHNLKDAGFPDRILWIKAAAEKYPYMDTSRIGIYGGSAGGQNAAAGVLFHPEFYKVAVAGCGCHDNRMDKSSWNEQWMGYPVGPQYSECSNIDNAERLRGKLLLIVGELDDNVPVESTYRFVDRLIKAGKDFDLIVAPGQGHGMGGEYGTRRMRDFFVRHLLGTEPPDRNSGSEARVAGNDRGGRGNRNRDDGASQGPVDLSAIKSLGSMASVAARFRADEASLQRYYFVANSPTTRERFRKFYVDWLAALVALPENEIADSDRTAYNELKNNILESFTRLEKQGQRRAKAASLVPFAPAILELAEERRAVKKVDSEKAAETIDQLAREIESVRTSLAERLKSRSADDAELSDENLKIAAETIGQLRANLNGWYRFYNGYDPMFTWWLKAPYEQANSQLEQFAALLAKPPAVSASATKQASFSSQTKPTTTAESTKLAAANTIETDVPDLAALVNAPPSTMEAVVTKFRADIPGFGGWGDDGGARFAGRNGPRGGAGGEGNGQESGRRAAVNRYFEDEDNDPASGNSAGAGERPRFGAGRRAQQNTPEARARRKTRLNEWNTALDGRDFDGMSQSDRIDYVLLKNQIQYSLRQLETNADSDDGETPAAMDASGIGGRPIGRDALLVELQHEMIPYTPEQLLEIAVHENEWCEAELLKASREMGLGDDWKKAVEKVKTMHVPPGDQPYLIHDLAWEAIKYLRANDLVTVPPLAAETWGLQMMSPRRQLINPFFTGGNEISVSFPTDTMTHDQKLQSMRGNNIPFARATVHHELIPGHNLQFFMNSRYKSYRRLFSTPFWGEGWALYWEMLLYDRGFPKTPEDRVGFLTWRKHRCARIVFSLSFHLGRMRPQECVDYLVANVGFDPHNAAAEVRRSFETAEPLYQCAYMLGGLQFRSLHRELVDSGKMTNRQFHDAVLQGGNMPVVMVRAQLTDQPLSKDHAPEWRFYDAIQGGTQSVAGAAP